MVWRAAVGLSRRAGARVPDLPLTGFHQQRARRCAARTAVAHRRRAARQPAESARAQLESVRARRLARHTEADHLRRLALRLRLASGRQGRPRQPVRFRHRQRRPGGNRQHAARRIRVGSQQHRSARRLRVDARRSLAVGGARRLRDLLQPGGARDVGRSVLQSAVLQSRGRVFRAGTAAVDAVQSFPQRTSRCSSRNRQPPISAISRRHGWNTGTSTCSVRSA